MQTRTEIDLSFVERIEPASALIPKRRVNAPMATLSREVRSFVLDIEEMKRAMTKLHGRDLEIALQAIDQRVREAQLALQMLGEAAARPYRKALDARLLAPRKSPRLVLMPTPMRVLRLRIENFQRIDKADIDFNLKLVPVTVDGIDPGSVYDALDLVLGPDRLGQYPPVEELDFYQAEFTDAHGRPPMPLSIEVILVNLSEEIERVCAAHTECWNVQDGCLTDPQQASTSANLIPCLRLRTVAAYNPDDTQCDADTYFPHSAGPGNGAPSHVDADVKRLLAPLYRSLMRASSRVLGSERSALSI